MFEDNQIKILIEKVHSSGRKYNDENIAGFRSVRSQILMLEPFISSEKNVAFSACHQKNFSQYN